jgi:hypothetical protein
MEVLLRRAAATGIKMSSMVKLLYQFSTMQLLEGVHPLQSGVFRLRHPDERRPGLPRENPILFRISLASDLVRKTRFALASLARLSFAAIRITRNDSRDRRRRIHSRPADPDARREAGGRPSEESFRPDA